MREEPIDRGGRCEDGMHAVNTLYIDRQHGQSLHVCVWRTAAGSAENRYPSEADARGQAAHYAEAGVALAGIPGFAVFRAPLVLRASRLHFA